MSEEKPAPASPPSEHSDSRREAATLARALVRTAWKGALATVSQEGGTPYASLVAVATEPDGSPLLLLSGLAVHTRNIVCDDRASIMIDGTPAGPSALTGPRVTLVGRIERASASTARSRYLARHPDAAGFIDFADFDLFALRIERAHLVAGFGRIIRLSASEVSLPVDDAQELLASEESILHHMNHDHSDGIALIATAAASDSSDSPAGSDSGPHLSWRMIGCDPDGIDLASGQRALRVPFPHRVNTSDAVRQSLIELVRDARANAKNN